MRSLLCHSEVEGLNNKKLELKVDLRNQDSSVMSFLPEAGLENGAGGCIAGSGLPDLFKSK